MQGFGLSTNGGISSIHQPAGHAVSGVKRTHETDDLPSIASGDANSCSVMARGTANFRTRDGEQEERRDAFALTNNRLFYERKEAARNGNRVLRLSRVRGLAVDCEKRGIGVRGKSGAASNYSSGMQRPT